MTNYYCSPRRLYAFLVALTFIPPSITARLRAQHIMFMTIIDGANTRTIVTDVCTGGPVAVFTTTLLRHICPSYWHMPSFVASFRVLDEMCTLTNLAIRKIFVASTRQGARRVDDSSIN
jgi:hypothetical protein